MFVVQVFKKPGNLSCYFWQMKLLFIVNPFAGSDKSDDVLAQIQEMIGETGFDHKFLETTGNGDTAAILSQLTNYKPTSVVACGGDGTIQFGGTQPDRQKDSNNYFTLWFSQWVCLAINKSIFQHSL